MHTLSLLRHAKSSWSTSVPGEKPVPDKDRQLAPRGERDAERMAAWIAANAIRPDLVLCSSARRTRQTLDLVRAAIGSAGTTANIHDDLYLADMQQLIEILHVLPDTIGHAMIIGHDPGLHELANLLVGDGEPLLLGLLGAKFSTAGIAVIDFKFARWRSLNAGTGRLRHFMAPKRLPDLAQSA